MSYIDKDVKVYIPTISAGEGNTASVLAVENILEGCGIEVCQFPLLAASIPAAIFHRAMTRFDPLRQQYNQKGEIMRTWGGVVIGLLSLAELLIRSSFEHHPNVAVIGGHEMVFATFPKGLLNKIYAAGSYFYVPDVEPKANAVEIMQDRGITPIVWNQQAYRRLQSRGLSPRLVEPLLPNAFANKHQVLAKDREHLLVKSSGSGMPKEMVQDMAEILDRLNFECSLWYSFYLPDRVLTNRGAYDFHYPLDTKIRKFYSKLLRQPPKIIISYPSEMVQVAAAKRIPMLLLPPRGHHEVVNGEWALRHGVALAKLNPQDKKDTTQKILDAWEYAKVVLREEEMGLGKLKLAEALFGKF